MSRHWVAAMASTPSFLDSSTGPEPTQVQPELPATPEEAEQLAADGGENQEHHDGRPARARRVEECGSPPAGEPGDAQGQLTGAAAAVVVVPAYPCSGTAPL